MDKDLWTKNLRRIVFGQQTVDIISVGKKKKGRNVLEGRSLVDIILTVGKLI